MELILNHLESLLGGQLILVALLLHNAALLLCLQGLILAFLILGWRCPVALGVAQLGVIMDHLVDVAHVLVYGLSLTEQEQVELFGHSSVLFDTLEPIIGFETDKIVLFLVLELVTDSILGIFVQPSHVAPELDVLDEAELDHVVSHHLGLESLQVSLRLSGGHVYRFQHLIESHDIFLLQLILIFDQVHLFELVLLDLVELNYAVQFYSYLLLHFLVPME